MPLTAYVMPLAGAAVLLGAWSILVEPRWLRVRRVELAAEDVGLPPLRILHLTDLHFHGRDATKLRFLRRLATEDEYDLVLFTGDLIHSPAGLPALREAAGLFRPRLGSFGVLGGHDHLRAGALATYWNLLTPGRPGRFCRPNPADEVEKALQDAGVKVLCDENRIVRDAGPLALIGLSDA
ncbi:MAG: metallophosphoesterase, partial [Candidatus Brocadiia bacterium]